MIKIIVGLFLFTASSVALADDYFPCQPSLNIQQFDAEWMKYGWRSPQVVQSLLCGVLKKSNYENTPYGMAILQSYADFHLGMTPTEWIEYDEIYGPLLPKNISMSKNFEFSKKVILKLSLQMNDIRAKYGLAMCLLGEKRTNSHFSSCEWHGFSQDRRQGLRLLSEIKSLPSSDDVYVEMALRYFALRDLKQGKIKEAYCSSLRQKQLEPKNEGAHQFHKDIIRKIVSVKGQAALPQSCNAQ